MFIYSYQQHDHLLPGNDRMLVIGSSALAKNHGHLKSSRLAADTLIFNFPLNHPRLWRQMEHSLSGARYSIILFMWPPLHLSPANGRLMEKPPEGGGPMESAEDMLCRLFAFLRKQTRRLILLSSPPSDYGSARHPYAEEPGVLEAWNALLRTLAGKLNLPFIDFCGDMLQYRPLPGSGEEDFPEAYRNLGKQVLHRLPFGQTWVRRRSGKIHRLLEKRRKRRKERMLARWRTLAAPPHYREETDWITAIHSEKGQARILLIGDSVMRHLWRPLASELQEDIDLFSSTLIPGDPDYLPTLAGYFPSAGYEAVIVSFGSHVTNKVSAISVDDFRKNYMAFVSQLSKRCRFFPARRGSFRPPWLHAGAQIYRSLPFLPSGPRVPGRENSRTAPAPSLRPAGTAKGTGMSENPPRTMKWTNERKPPNYFPYGEKRLPPAKIPAPAFKDFKFPPFFKLQTSLFRPERSLHALSLPGLFLPAAPSSRPFP